ncbi:DUF3047 domain-containing protein [Parasphingorhabdus sp.]
MFAAFPAEAQTGAIQRISNFETGTAGWRSIRIDKKVPATTFRIRQIEGVTSVEARARNSMALFTRRVMVDLNRTPILCWRWRVSDVVRTADISKKSGDDQAARIYIGLDLPNSSISLGTRAKLAIARARGGNDIPDGAINYVWDNRYPVGTARNNVYTRQAKIIVAQSGSSQAQQWITERHDLASDIRKQFRTRKAKVTSVAISSDTDNSGETVRAAFADIHAVSASAPCRF